MAKKKPYQHTPAHVRRLRSEKNQALPIINAMIQAFDNEDYQASYRLAVEAQESLAKFWATFNMLRGGQENGVKEGAWIN